MILAVEDHQITTLTPARKLRDLAATRVVLVEDPARGAIAGTEQAFAAVASRDVIERAGEGERAVSVWAPRALG
jgi:hypothetical protein